MSSFYMAWIDSRNLHGNSTTDYLAMPWHALQPINSHVAVVLPRLYLSARRWAFECPVAAPLRVELVRAGPQQGRSGSSDATAWGQINSSLEIARRPYETMVFIFWGNNILG